MLHGARVGRGSDAGKAPQKSKLVSDTVFQSGIASEDSQTRCTPASTRVAIRSEAYLQRTGSLLASSDQLRAVSRQFTDWIPEHRWPVTDIDVALTKLDRSVESLAGLLESESVSPSEPDSPAIGRGLDGLRLTLLELLLAMHRESERRIGVNDARSSAEDVEARIWGEREDQMTNQPLTHGGA